MTVRLAREEEHDVEHHCTSPNTNTTPTPRRGGGVDKECTLFLFYFSLLLFDTIVGISQRAHDEVLKQVKDIHHIDLHLELDEEDVHRVARENKEKEKGTREL
jgi:hypothetical protein